MNTSALRNHLRLLAESAPADDLAFAKSLVELGRLASKELGTALADECATEPQRRDLLRDLARFTSDQKVVDWAHAHGILLTKGTFWWWMNDDDRPAEIIGVPNSLGLPRITNGIDVWIERQDGTPFLGHRDWLKWHRRSAAHKAANGVGVTAQANGNGKVVEVHRQTALLIIANRTFDAFAQKFLATVGRPPMLSLDEDNPECEENVAELTHALEEYFKCVAMRV